MSVPWSHSFAIVTLYRLDRCCYLAFGSRWRAIRLLLLPFLALVRPCAGSEINYQSDIGPGLLILHPSLGVVVSGNLPSKDGSYSLYCAVIVKKVDAKTRAKTSINELLRGD